MAVQNLFHINEISIEIFGMIISIDIENNSFQSYQNWSQKYDIAPFFEMLRYL